MFVSTARGRAFSSCPCDSLLRPQLSLGRNLLVFAGCLTLALRQVRAAARRARPLGLSPGHEVAYASSARGLWCSGACRPPDGRLQGGRSCLVFSTHDRAGEMKRTGGSEDHRRTSGPREWPTHPARGVCGVRGKYVELAVSNLHISTSGGLSAARPRTSYFNFFKLSKNRPHSDVSDTE